MEICSVNLEETGKGTNLRFLGNGIESCGLACITWRVSAVRKDSALESLCLLVEGKITGEGGQRRRRKKHTSSCP